MQITVYEEGMQTFALNLESFNKEIIGFGRQPDCDIVLHSDFVSRVHGYIYKENGQWMIEDAGSTSGIFCNGQKIGKLRLYNNLNLVIPFGDRSVQLIFTATQVEEMFDASMPAQVQNSLRTPQPNQVQNSLRVSGQMQNTMQTPAQNPIQTPPVGMGSTPGYAGSLQGKKKRKVSANAIRFVVYAAIIVIIGIVIHTESDEKSDPYGNEADWETITVDEASIKIPDNFSYTAEDTIKYMEDDESDGREAKVYKNSDDTIEFALDVADLRFEDALSAEYGKEISAEEVYESCEESLKENSNVYDLANGVEATYNGYTGMEWTYRTSDNDARNWEHEFVIYDDGYLIDFHLQSTSSDKELYHRILNTLEY